jgi:hypothetical protein
MNKLKLTQNQILKLNNQTYYPYLIHNLPNFYQKINLKYIIKLNSIIYINSTQIKKYSNNQFNKINFESTLNFSNINKNSLK